MGNVDMSFKYVNAADSAKPGYLAAKFAKIIAEQKAKAATVAQQKPLASVSKIKTK